MTEDRSHDMAHAEKWRDLLRQLALDNGSRLSYSAVSTWLATLGMHELTGAIESKPPDELSNVAANVVAAMVEHVCAKYGVPAPLWTHGVAPLASPVFASELESIRLHLLTNSPAAYRRRNIFIDTPVGGQV